MRPFKLTGFLLCFALVACDSASMPTWASLTDDDDAPAPAAEASAPAPAPQQNVGGGNLLVAGKTFLQMGKYQEAHDSYLAATKQDPMNVHAWNGLGTADDMMGDLSDALDAYEHAMALNPKDYSTVNNMGHLYIQTGNVDRAAKFLEPYGHDPNAPEVLKQNYAIALKKSQELKSPAASADGAEIYADLGSYPTEGMAQGRLGEIRGLLHDDTVKLTVEPETKVAGGVPTYTIKATGRPPSSICTIMNAQAFPCIPYGPSS